MDGLVTTIACAGPSTSVFDTLDELDEWDALASGSSWPLQGLSPSVDDGDSRIPDG
jgi:hypothetical protein